MTDLSDAITHRISHHCDGKLTLHRSSDGQGRRRPHSSQLRSIGCLNPLALCGVSVGSRNLSGRRRNTLMIAGRTMMCGGADPRSATWPAPRGCLVYEAKRRPGAWWQCTAKCTPTTPRHTSPGLDICTGFLVGVWQRRTVPRDGGTLGKSGGRTQQHEGIATAHLSSLTTGVFVRCKPRTRPLTPSSDENNNRTALKNNLMKNQAACRLS